MVSEAEIIADVTGSNAQLGSALAGVPYFPTQSLDAGGLQTLPSIPGIPDQKPVAGTSAGGGFLSDLFGGTPTNPNNPVSALGQLLSGGGGNQAGAWSWTDIPRVATVAIGFIIIIVGLFALTKGNPLAIVEKTVS